MQTLGSFDVQVGTSTTIATALISNPWKGFLIYNASDLIIEATSGGSTTYITPNTTIYLANIASEGPVAVLPTATLGNSTTGQIFVTAVYLTDQVPPMQSSQLSVVNIGNTPNVSIPGIVTISPSTGTVFDVAGNMNVTNASIDVNPASGATFPISGNVQANITNASLDVTGNVAVTSGNVNATITNASIPITGNVTADISNATIPITGNVGITSGTVDATITNATLNIAPASGATFEMTTNALSPPAMVIPDPIILTGNALAFTDASGQLGAQNVAVTVLPSQTNRAYLAIQNLSSGDLWFNVLTTATETSGSILLSSGVGFEYTTAVPTGAISMISNVANCPYTLHYVTK